MKGDREDDGDDATANLQTNSSQNASSLQTSSVRLYSQSQ